MIAETPGPLERREVMAVAVREADAVVRYGSCGPDTLREMSEAHFRWALDKDQPAEFRLSLARRAARLAARAVELAPSDYLTWLALARSKAIVGEWDAAESYLEESRRWRTKDHPVILFPD